MIQEWWQALSMTNQAFYLAAVFFSVIFLWQILAMLLGTAGGGDEHSVDTSADTAAVHDHPTDGHDTLMAFKLISVRSVLAFFTLFTWAGAMYLNIGMPLLHALLYAIAWGFEAMVIVSWLVYIIRKLAESGNRDITRCVGGVATVYMDIPAGGTGEIRVLCGGVMTHCKARGDSGQAIPAETLVNVSKALGPDLVEVSLTVPEGHKAVQ